MPEIDEAEEARRRSFAAANNWDQLTVTGRSYVAVALSAATLIGVSMAWSCLPAAMAMLKAGSGSDRFQFLFAYAALIGGPALGWLLWWGRRHGFAVAALVVFGLSVGALLPVAQG